MLLNKLHVLDKGYVALIQSTFDSVLVSKIRDEFMSGETSQDDVLTEKLSRAVMLLKMPLFATRSLSQHGIVQVNLPHKGDLEAYLPNPGEVASGDHELDVSIADDIARTTQALLINPKAYESDGCNRFVAQLITPVNVYVTLIANGTYNQWKSFSEMRDTPDQIKAYQKAVKEIMRSEWKFYE
jgi:hypothetical protein